MKAKEKGKTFISDYLQENNLPTNRHFNCLNPEHDDKNPSMMFDKERNKVHCFSCNADYDIYDLVSINENISIKEAFKYVYDKYNIKYDNNFLKEVKQDKQPPKADHLQSNEQLSNDNVKELSFSISISSNVGEITTIKKIDELYKYCLNNASKLNTNSNYLTEKRGIKLSTVNEFNILTNITYSINQEKGQKGILIPTSKNSFVIRNQDTDNKSMKFRKLGNNNLFNIEAISNKKADDHTPIFLVESEIDLLSLASITNYKGIGVALGTTNNTNKLINYLKDTNLKPNLILLLDNDETGKNTTKALSKELTKLNIKHIDKVDILKDYKDVNELLIKEPEELKSIITNTFTEAYNLFEEQAQQERKEYYNTSVKGKLLTYYDDIQINKSIPTPTQFNLLDNFLNGGLYEGLYIIGAISSLGKTTFTIQIADQIAKEQDKDILIFSLEMSANELISKSISRLTYENGGKILGKSSRGVLDTSRYRDYTDEEKQTIKNAITEYGNYKGNIFIHEGIGDIGALQIRETVEQHIKITGKTPIVIIDYIQLLAPYTEKGTDKQNTDKNVLELKRISRDFKTSVIGISSLNRASYDKTISMSAFKESGAIEYSCDVLIGLQLKDTTSEEQTITAKAQDIRKIELHILKNRSGQTGNIIDVYYKPVFNYFTEQIKDIYEIDKR